MSHHYYKYDGCSNYTFIEAVRFYYLQSVSQDCYFQSESNNPEATHQINLCAIQLFIRLLQTDNKLSTMTKIINSLHLVCILAIIYSTSSFADELITKEVYSFKTENGTPVFTDKRPVKREKYQTQTIETAGSAPTEISKNDHYSNTRPIEISQTQTVIVSNKTSKTKRSKIKQKHNETRCLHYKEKFTYYSNRMRGGYRSSEYKKLEKNRKKYRKLLFNKCETKTFSD